MKKLRIIALMAVLTLISADSFGGGGLFKKNRAEKPQKALAQGPGHGHGKPTTGAPLDGGLLALLGAAGVAYYGARRKKKQAAAE